MPNFTALFLLKLKKAFYSDLKILKYPLKNPNFTLKFYYYMFSSL